MRDVGKSAVLLCIDSCISLLCLSATLLPCSALATNRSSAWWLALCPSAVWSISPGALEWASALLRMNRWQHHSSHSLSKSHNQPAKEEHLQFRPALSAPLHSQLELPSPLAVLAPTSLSARTMSFRRCESTFSTFSRSWTRSNTASLLSFKPFIALCRMF
jgi:hypothetical protein